MLRWLYKKFSSRNRRKRGEFFRSVLKLESTDSILDLGGGNGSYINSILKNKHSENITVCDISNKDLNEANSKFSYTIRKIEDQGDLPFDNKEFDVVFCNSVIEHVTVPKIDIWSYTNSKEFTLVSLEKQAQFAKEIDRIGKSFFLQTPNKFFLIESHTWLPGLIVFLPRKTLVKLIAFTNKFWFKKTQPDWNLLTYKDLKHLFPNASIYKEKWLGITKSYIVVKTNR